MANKTDKQIIKSSKNKNKHLLKDKVNPKTKFSNKVFKANDIKQCYDGNLRWVCKCDLKSHPIILFTICKIFIIASFVSSILFLIFGKNANNHILTAFLIFVCSSVISCAILFFVYYFIYAKLKKYYCTFYEMDNKTLRQYIANKTADFEQLENLINNIGKTDEKFNAFSKLHRLAKRKIFCKFSDIKKITVYEEDYMLEVITKDWKRLQIYSSLNDIKFIYNHLINHCNKNITVCYK